MLLSSPATYLNVINKHRLGLVKTYKKINKGEPEEEWRKKNIKEAHNIIDLNSKNLLV